MWRYLRRSEGAVYDEISEYIHWTKKLNFLSFASWTNVVQFRALNLRWQS